MSPLEQLRDELRRSRAAMLSAVAGLPEAALYRPRQRPLVGGAIDRGTYRGRESRL